MRLSELTAEFWQSLPSDGRNNLCDEIAKIVGTVSTAVTCSENAIWVYDQRNEVNFRFIFRHTTSFGLSDKELIAAEVISTPLQANIDEMRPFQRVQIPAFLIAREPIRNSSPLVSSRNHKDTPPHFPAYMDYELAENLCKKIGATPPTELQLEAAVRGGRKSLFCFGNELPTPADLEIWLSHDLNQSARRPNDFGLTGLFFPEWTCEDFQKSHDVSATKLKGSKVIKGGGAYFWPWQDDEWVWCISAMRMPSLDLIEHEAVVRPVITVP